MRRSSALLLFFGVSFGVFAVILGTRRGGDRRELEYLDPETSEALADSPRTSVDAIPAPAPTPIETRGRESTDGAATEEALAQGPHWNVHVVDESLRVSIPDADVFFFSPLRISEVLLIEDPRVFFDMTKFYWRNGLHRKTNDAGIAEIPVVEGSFWVVALAPGLFGGGTFKSKAVIGGQFDLTMRPAETLEVLVLRARDREPQAGVAVALRDEGLMSFPVGAKSDAQGIARIGPCTVRRDNEPARFVTVHGVFKKPIEAWVRPHSEPRPELLVPDSERLLVRIVDARGKVCPIDGELVLDWDGRPKIPVAGPKVPIHSGTVSIPRVELGIQLTLTANVGVAGTQLTKEFTMPEIARDQQVDLALDPATPILRARLARADGQAFGPATWQVNGEVLCDPSRGNPVLNAGTIRGTGVITFALAGFPATPCPTVFAVRVHPLTGEDVGGVFRVSLSAGVNDLGDWMLGPGSLLCSGRVVDSDGVGIAGRAVELFEGFHGETMPAMLASAALSGADGGFELRGWSEKKEFRINGNYGLVKLGQTGISIVYND